MSSVPIEKVKAFAYKIPTDQPESDGTLEWDSTTIVIAEISAGGKIGLGYTYSDQSAAEVIQTKFSKVLSGSNVMDINSNWNKMKIAVRNIAGGGIVNAAISAVDTALWDLKARVLNIPLAELMGKVRDSVPIYGSGGFTSYSIKKLTEQMHGYIENGINRVKMKIGREPALDVKRVAEVRNAIGTDAELMVDANGAYNPKQAISFSENFETLNVCWFEEPVSSDDLKGLNFIRNKVPSGIQIAAGEYGYDLFYFRRMINAEAVDVLQADATRCGGYTGFLNAAVLCESSSIQISSHTAPALHVHPCLSVIPLKHSEYFYDHVRIEKMIFDGIPEQVNGRLFPHLSLPGNGLELKRQDVEKFIIS